MTYEKYEAIKTTHGVLLNNGGPTLQSQAVERE